MPPSSATTRVIATIVSVASSGFIFRKSPDGALAVGYFTVPVIQRHPSVCIDTAKNTITVSNMPRDPSARENRIKAKARRDHALARLDLRSPSVPRDPAVGPTSHAIKKIDTGTRAAIDEFMARQKVDNG